MNKALILIPATVAMAIFATSLLSPGQGASKAAARDGSEADRAAIERLHEEDKEATLSDSADQLAKLWDKDAVRLLPGRPAEIGAAVIYADDKRWEMSSGRERSLCYDLEIQDVQIAGDWAFEWGQGSYKTSKDGKESVGYGKVLRVMKRQSDRTWRFARVMGLLAPSASAVILEHPCPAENNVASISVATTAHINFVRVRVSSEADRAAIERLHQEDKEATLSDSVDQLAKLWDKEAVRLPAGRPAEIGAAVIYADDKRWEMSSGRERTLCYDYEIQDVQIAGDRAFEWGYFSGKILKDDKVSIFYGKGLRIMKKQPDGTWRFAWVMSLPDSSRSGVVLQHPCQ